MLTLLFSKDIQILNIMGATFVVRSTKNPKMTPKKYRRKKILTIL